ncbi:TlpA disulfide reductase family protein [Sulfurimonas sp.]|uniref:TlpA disulfide reductase family protein n=1 Tax=Sulfurimonas sp. TaxID=2022749 RepID=UPI003D0FA9AF
MKKLLMMLLTSVALCAMPNVGDKEVGFTLPNLYKADQKLSNTNFHGKVTLVNIWASWCTGCQEEMPLFVKLQKKFSKKNFEIVLINIDTEQQNGIDFLADVDKSKTLTALYDVEKSMAKAYRCPGMPSSFLVDKDGNILEVFAGSLNESDLEKLEEKLEKLLGK